VKTILVIDDEPDIAEVTGDLLELEGYRVLRASNGQEALPKIAEDAPDLIITDMMMPLMDGRELLAALKENGTLARIPVIAISATDLSDVKELYGVACMQKPFDVDGLLEYVAVVLNAKDG